jgi:hypothetical protein
MANVVGRNAFGDQDLIYPIRIVLAVNRIINHIGLGGDSVIVGLIRAFTHLFLLL